MVEVGQIMTREVQACEETDDAREASRRMSDRNIGCVLILDNADHVVGIVTDRDITCRLVAAGLSFETPLRDIMSEPVHCCRPDDDIADVAIMMKEYRVRRLGVVDEDGCVVGIVALGDMARNLHGLWKGHQLAATLEGVSTH